MSPRERFALTMAAKPFAEMAAKPEFQAALDASLLQMGDNISTSNDPDSAKAHHFRLEGARMFARILQGMGRKEEAPKVEEIGQLKQL